MASSTATTAVLVLLNRTVFTTDMLILSPEIPFMAGRTERCVLGRWIDKRRGHDITVAAATARVSSMITGIVTLRVMTEKRWRPAIGGMTLVTLQIGIKMA